MIKKIYFFILALVMGNIVLGGAYMQCVRPTAAQCEECCLNKFPDKGAEYSKCLDFCKKSGGK